MISPEVSIIVPVYNVEQFLDVCLHSVITLERKDWELILINDGSKDNSRSICERYAEADNRIKVVNKDNEGVSAARNLGLQLAKGKWISFIDADDAISSNYLPERLSEDVDLYVTHWQYLGVNELEEWMPSQVVKGDDLTSLFEKNAHSTTFTTVWGKIFKKKTLSQNGVLFDTRLRLGEDTLFFMQVEALCKSLVITDGIYYYRRSPYENWIKKYINTPEESLLYYSLFHQYYLDLRINAPKLVVNTLNNISNVTDFSSRSRFLWKISPQVIRMKELLYHTMTIREKVKFRISRIISFFFPHFS